MADLYSVLGIAKTATNQEISKAFRKLSLVYHPDKISPNLTEEEKTAQNSKYAEIKEAYDILSDSDKRKIYDHGGMDGVRNHQNHQGHQGFPGHPGGGFFHQVIKVQPVTTKEYFTFSELYNGCTKTIKYKTKLIDDKNQHQMYECGTEDKEVEVTIPPMTPFGKQIQLRGEGTKHKKNNNISGDLIIIIEHDPKDTCIWSFDNNDNVTCTVKISLIESLVGFSRVLPHPNRSKPDISIKASNITRESTKIINDSTVHTTTEKGSKTTSHTKTNQQLYIKFVIEYPERLSEKQRQGIAKVFGHTIPTQVQEGIEIGNLAEVRTDINDNTETQHGFPGMPNFQQTFQGFPGMAGGMPGVQNMECNNQ